MKKRISLLSIILLGLSSFLFACTKPYENLRLSVSVSEVVLYLPSNATPPVAGDESDDQMSEYPLSRSVDVVVSGAKGNTKTDVRFAQVGSNTVLITDVEKTGSTTSFNLVAKNAGESVITITTVEGNLRERIRVTVYRMLESIDFKSEVIAMKPTDNLMLSDYLVFNPAETNQKETNFYIIHENYTGATQTDDFGNIIETEYAVIENGILKIKDKDLAPQDLINRYNYVEIQAQSVFNNELKTRVKRIPVLNLIDDNEIILKVDNDSQKIDIHQNMNGEYEIVLASNKTGSSSSNLGLFKRRMEFRIGSTILVDKNYSVSHEYENNNPEDIVNVIDSTNYSYRYSNLENNPIFDEHNNPYINFDIEQLKVGTTVVVFKVDYTSFKGQFTKNIKVRFTVKAFPTTIEAEDAYGNKIANNSAIEIFNEYGRNSFGTMLKFNAYPNTEYLAYSVRLLNDNSSNLIVKNQYGFEIDVLNELIADGRAIYLSHNLKDSMPEDPRLLITYYYTLAPSGSLNDGYKVYTESIEIKLVYKIGLSEINVPATMLIDAANKTLINPDNGTVSNEILFASIDNSNISLIDSIAKIEFITFNQIPVKNIAGFDLNVYTNEYYELNSIAGSNKITITPNGQGKTARFRLRITTNNGIVAESEINIIVPMVYQNSAQLAVVTNRANASLFKSSYEGYNLSVDDAGYISIKRARDIDGNFYDENNALITEGSITSPLEISYESIKKINIKSNSQLAFSFVNYMPVQLHDGSYSIVALNYINNVVINGYSSDYMSFEKDVANGIITLKTKGLTTLGSPRSFNVNYMGYDLNGQYRTLTMVVEIEITAPLQAISLTPKTGVLYEKTSVGALNETKSSVDISINTNNNIILTGNDSFEVGFEMSNDVLYVYRFNIDSTQYVEYDGQMVNVIDDIRAYNSPHISVSDTGSVSVAFTSNDIANITQKGVMATVVAEISDSLNAKLEEIFKLRYRISVRKSLSEVSYITAQYDAVKREVKATLFANDLRVRVSARVSQHGAQWIYADAEYSVVFAQKVENIILDNVGEDGIYFDTRKTNELTKNVTVYSLPRTATDGTLIAKIRNNTIARIISGVNALGEITGDKVVIESLRAGETTIVISAKDDYQRLVVGGQEQIVEGMHVEFRIKVADGSEQYPFEIRTASEFDDIRNYSSAYHYVIARDINLININFKPFENFTGGLTGKFTYFNNGVYQTVQNTIYSLTINETINIANSSTGNYSDYQVGLFKSVGSTAKISDLILKSANVTVNVTKNMPDNDNTEYNKAVSIGVVAGKNSANLTNVFVQGSLKVNSNISNLNVGGVVGLGLATFNNDLIITGKILNDFESNTQISSDMVNSQVNIEVISAKNISEETNTNVGGVVGSMSVSDQKGKEMFAGQMYYQGLTVVDNITSDAFVASYYKNSNEDKLLNGANVGGVVGYAKNLVLTNIESFATLRGYANVGGIIGFAQNTYLDGSSVLIFEQGLTGQAKTNLIATTNLGGLVGVGQNLNIAYSYVRNFMGTPNTDLAFFDNMMLIIQETNNPTEQEYSVGGLVGKLNSAGNLSNIYFNTATGKVCEGDTKPNTNFITVKEGIALNTISHSYFNAGINLRDTTIAGYVYAGGLVGFADHVSDNIITEIENSYVLGNIWQKELSDELESTIELQEDDTNIFAGTYSEKELLKRTVIIDDEPTDVNSNVVQTVTTTVDDIRTVQDGQGKDVILARQTITVNNLSLVGLFVGNEQFELVVTAEETNSPRVVEVYDIDDVLLATVTFVGDNPVLTDFTTDYPAATSIKVISASTTTDNTYEYTSSHENVFINHAYSMINFDAKLTHSQFAYYSKIGLLENAVWLTETSTDTTDEALRIKNSTEYVKQHSDYSNTAFKDNGMLFAGSASKASYYNVTIFDALGVYDQFDSLGAYYEDLIELYPTMIRFTASRYAWYYYENLNNDMPLLINKNSDMLLYLVIPSSVSAKVVDIEIQGTSFNQSYVKVNDGKAVLFHNALLQGNSPSYNNKYQVLQTGQALPNPNIYNVIEVNLNINLNDDMIFQPEVDRQIVITSSNQSVVRILPNGVIETLSAGVAKIRIATRLNPNIYTEIDVLVINGISGFGLVGKSAYTKDDLYVDNTNYYLIENYNIVSENAYYANYRINTNVGYVVQVSESSTGEIALNNIVLEHGKIYAFENMREFNTRGITPGSVDLIVTPFIKTTVSEFGETITADNATVAGAILINELTNDNFLKLEIMQKASSITTENQKNVRISPIESTEIWGNVTTSSFSLGNYLNANGQVTPNNFASIVSEQIILTITDAKTNETLFVIENLFDAMNTSTEASDKYMLVLSYSLNNVNVEEVRNSENEITELKISFKISVQFDTDKYKNANNGQTHNLNEQNYVLSFSPKSNPSLVAVVNVDIIPNSVNRITTTFYAGNEYTQNGNEAVFNPHESSTDYIAPGKYGLMKLYLFPEFNDAEYVELTVSTAHKELVSFQQMLELYSSDEYSNVIGYSTVQGHSIIVGDGSGIRLRNMSLIENQGGDTSTLFNGSYFARIGLSSAAIEGQTITFTVSAYKTVNGSAVLIKDASLNLTVQPLPRIEISYLGYSEGIATVGSKAEIEIKGFNYDGEIEVTVSAERGDKLNTPIQYDATTKKWYLDIRNNAMIGDTITVTARATKYISGMDYNAVNAVQIRLVDYIVKGLSLDSASSAIVGQNTLEILNGTSNELSVTIDAVYSSSALNGQLNINKQILEGVIAGRFETVNSLPPNNLVYLNNWYMMDGAGDYRNLSINTQATDNHGGVFKFTRVNLGDYNNTTYLAISGLKTNAGDYTLGVMFRYYYDNNGRLQIFTGSDSDSLGMEYKVYSTEMYKFRLIVLDNSTYDHPNPVNTVEDFYNMQQGAHYILTSDLVLENHVPFEANFASLDGNGYVVTIKNFNTAKYTTPTGGTNTQANVGLFEIIAQSTVIKNITINIAPLLETKINVNKAIAAHSNIARESTKIDLTRTRDVTFGVLAGINRGTITNAHIVNLDNSDANVENKMLFVNTIQTQLNGQNTTAKIGGLVGQNNGSISNSYVGINYRNITSGQGRVEDVVVNGTLSTRASYNFAIAGGRQIAGFVHTNAGTISNSYNKEVAVINISSIADLTNAAGFVAINSGTVYGSFVEGAGIETYRSNDSIYVESKGNIGGFVYTNTGSISEAYSNITIKTNSGRSGGFVYNNENPGQIRNAYSSGLNGASNSTAHGAFTGVNEKSDYNNTGKMTSVFYLRRTTETENVNEPALAITGADDTNSDGNPFRYEGSFNEFSFTSDNQTENGIWIMGTDSNYGPQLTSAYYSKTMSVRTLVSKDTDPNDPSYVIHNYEYHADTQLGTAKNPYLVSTAQEFLNIVISTSRTYTNGNNRMYIFGISFGHIRLVNNLNFNVVDLNKFIISNRKITDIVFAGVLDGNGMIMSGINLLDENIDKTTENYGFFNQIGLSNQQYAAFVKHSLSKHEYVNPTIKNLVFNIGSFQATNSFKVGALAGSIYDSNLINVTINSGDTIITGRNLVGAFAGLIKYEKEGAVKANDLTNEGKEESARISPFTMIGLRTNGVSVTSSASKNSVHANSEMNRYGLTYYKNGNTDVSTLFNTYALLGEQNEYDYLQKLSYAGSIAGVLQGVNRAEADLKIKSKINSPNLTANQDINAHRSVTNTKISDLKVSGGGIIRAEHAGGLFGYVGKDTHIKKAVYEITSTDKLYGIYGFNYSGGIVAENYGMIEKANVEHEKDVQEQYDKRVSEGYSQVQGSKTLFSTTTLSVATGGIAGYMDGAIILDSYVKVNVVNAGARIAGGVVGLVTRENYISHTFVTGDVYAADTMGGIFGLYNQSGNSIVGGNADVGENRGLINPPEIENSEQKLLLDYVVALNSWGTETKENIQNNIREYYSDKNGSYYKFNLVMPEIGNQAPEISGASNIIKVPTTSPFKYVGSIGGRITVGNQTTSGYTLDAHNKMFITQAGITSTIPTSRKVALTSEDKDNPESTVVSVSFSDANVLLSGATPTGNEPDGNNSSVIGDIIGYNTEGAGNSTIGRQLKFAQAVGVEAGFKNEFFKWGIDEAVFADILAESSSQIWRMPEEGRLPIYIVGIFSNYEVIDTSAQLQELINNTNTQNKYFVLKPNREAGNGVYTINTSGSVSSLFNNTFSGILIGESSNGTKPTINIDYGTAALTTSIFRSLSAATITNIDFNINVESNGTKEIKDITDPSPNFGLFARDVNSTNISNVNITLTANRDTTFSSKVESIKSFGMVFGSLHNTNINNMNVDIKFNAEVGTDADVAYESIAGFAGIVSDSELRNINVYGNDKGLVVSTENADKRNLYVSGFVGRVYSQTKNSTLSNINNDVAKAGKKNYQVKVTSTHTDITLFAAGIVASGSGFTITNANYNGNLTLGSVGVIAGQSYVGGIIAYISGASTIKDIYFNSYYTNDATGYVYNKVVNQSITLNTAHGAIVGGLVGYMINSDIQSSDSSTVQTEEQPTVNNSADIKVTISSPSGAGRWVYVGGLVGQFIGNNTRLTKAFNAGNIEVIRSGAGDANVYIGGIIANASNVDINQVFNYGEIAFNTDRQFAVGGIVGYVEKSISITDFISLGDINYTGANTFSSTNVIGGVFGRTINNQVMVALNNGYTVARIFKNGAVVTGKSLHVNMIGADKERITTTNVYWVYEFAPESIANTKGTYISYLNLKDLTNTNEVTMKIAGFSDSTLPQGKKLGDNFSLAERTIPYITGMTSYVTIDKNNENKLFTAGGKFSPISTISNLGDLNNSDKYVVLTNTYDYSYNCATINFNGFLIGGTTANAFIKITRTAESALFADNTGVIANILLEYKGNVHIENSGYFAKNNNGVMINTTVYGQITDDIGSIQTAGLVYTNNGTIVNSSATLLYTGDTEYITHGAIVYKNNGLIDSSYSNTIFTNDGTVYGLAENNAGTITNSYFGGFFTPTKPQEESGARLLIGNVSKVDKSNKYDQNTFPLKPSENAASTSNMKNAETSTIGNKFTASVMGIDNKINDTINYGYPVIINGPKIDTAFGVTFLSMNLTDDNYYKVGDITGFQSDTTNRYLPIYNTAMFESIAKNILYNHILLTNLDFKDYSGSVMSDKNIFKNIIGNDKEIKNITSNSTYSLFESFNDAVIANITITNVTSSASIKAIIAKTMSYARLKNITLNKLVLSTTGSDTGLLAGTMTNTRIHTLNITNSTVVGNSQVGLVAGEIDGIYSSVAEVTIDGGSVNGNSYVGAMFGKVTGTISQKIDIQSVTITGTSVTGNSDYIGGMIGYTEYVKIQTAAVQSRSGKKTDITGTQYVGGLIGQAKYSEIEKVIVGDEVWGNAPRSEISINVTGTEKVGGIVGDAVASKVTDSGNNTKKTFYEIVTITNANKINGNKYVGGVIGFADGTIISGVATYSYISPNGGSHTQFGGIVGYMSWSTLEDSFAKTHITAKDEAGGAAGYVLGGAVRNVQVAGQIVSESTNEATLNKDNGSRKYKLGGISVIPDTSIAVPYDHGSAADWSYFGKYDGGWFRFYLDEAESKVAGQITTTNDSFDINIGFGFIVGKENGSTLSGNSAYEDPQGASFTISGLLDYYTKYNYTATHVSQAFGNKTLTVYVRVATYADVYNINSYSYKQSGNDKFSVGGRTMSINRGDSFKNEVKTITPNYALPVTNSSIKKGVIFGWNNSEINQVEFQYIW